MNKVSGLHLVERLDAPGPVQPLKRGYKSDVGLDLTTLTTRIIWPFCTVDLPTGWDISLPLYTWGSIKARSSTLSHRRLLVLEGVIDPGYKGELSVIVFNPTPWPRVVHAGDRLAQFIILPVMRYEPQYDESKTGPGTSHWVDERGSRGSKGFGSTGE